MNQVEVGQQDSGWPQQEKLEDNPDSCNGVLDALFLHWGCIVQQGENMGSVCSILVAQCLYYRHCVRDRPIGFDSNIANMSNLFSNKFIRPCPN